MDRRNFLAAASFFASSVAASKSFGRTIMNKKNIKREYGWAFQHESPEYIDLTGTCPDKMMASMREADRTFQVDIEPWNTLQFQGSQGSCAGHALSHMSQIVFTQNTGIKRMFSRACGYYEAQRFDGINGDRGSTISGGIQTMQAGILLEDDWKYPARYDNRRPEGFDTAPRLRIPHSKRLLSADQVWEFLKAGGVVQTGITWGPSFEKERADRSNGIGYGGHSTILYGFDPEDPEGWCVHHNSWDGWGDNGRSFWSKQFIADILKQRWTMLVGYQAQGLDIDPRLFEV